MSVIFNEYENIYVARAGLTPEEFEALGQKLNGLIEKGSGSVLVSEDWGTRRLAYPIKRQSHGHYVYLNFVGPAGLPLLLERAQRIDDNLIRFLTVKLDDNVDVEQQRLLALERHRIRTERLAAEREEAEAAARAEVDYYDDDDDDDDRGHDDSDDD